MAFQFKRKITINAAQVPSTQTNFPMVVSGTYSFLATQANGGNVTNASGYDIGFYSDFALTIKLNWETVVYTAATGAVEYHVLIPSISNGTVIYLAYGNTSITTDQSASTAVWDSNYKGVWHLPNGTSLTVNDSTSNAKNFTNNGTWGAAAGQIDGGTIKSNGTNQSLSQASITSPTSITISYWQKYLTADLGNTGLPVAFNFGNTSSASPRILAHSPYSDGTLYWDYGDATALNGRITVDYTPYLNIWALVELVYDNTNGLHAIYINGSSVASNTHSTSNPNLTGLTINAVAANNSYDKRQIDEIRLSDIARPANWITAEYNNQLAPDTFYSLGGAIGASTITGISSQTGTSSLTF